MTMSETAWIIGEIIVGIALLGLLSAVVTVIMVRLLSPASPAAEILQQRYARGDLTREQYEQMRQDLGISALSGDSFPALQSNGREAEVVPGSPRAR